MKFQMTKWNRNLVSLQGITGLLIAVILSGCSLPFFGSYGENGQTREEFTRYVESVFKLQNSMTSEMMGLADSDDKPANMDTLLQAEQTMQKKCEALNEYASLDSEGSSTSLLLQNRVAQSAKECEKAAKDLQTLLKKR
jgi:hypothetical protein